MDGTEERVSHVQKGEEWSKQRPSAPPEAKFKSNAVQGTARGLFPTRPPRHNLGAKGKPSEAVTAT